MDIKPTRSGLLQTKKRLTFADKGYDLLKQKYDALMMRFVKQMNLVKEYRQELADLFEQSEFILLRSESLHGVFTVQSAVSKLSPSLNIFTSFQESFGVKHPSLQAKEMSSNDIVPSVFASSFGELELLSAQLFEKKDLVLKLINAQLSLSMIAKELLRTKKKVNSLEKRVIPELENTKRKITFVLEEQERELFTTLKKVKEKKQKV
ncbi:MAG: V-type ATP synthase subunit D [Nanobdellota archaeon]